MGKQQGYKSKRDSSVMVRHRALFGCPRGHHHRGFYRNQSDTSGQRCRTARQELSCCQRRSGFESDFEMTGEARMNLYSQECTVDRVSACFGESEIRCI